MDIIFEKLGKYGIYNNKETLSLVRRKFSCKNPNPKASVYSKQINFISANGRFDLGLYFEIRKFVDKMFPDANIVETSEFKECVYPYFLSKDIEKIDGITYYTYQEESIASMLEKGRGIIKIPTGGGKGIIMAGYIKTILNEDSNLKILCMVPNISLVNQLNTEFVKCGLNTTRWTGDLEPDLDASVLICNNQILTSDKNRTEQIVKNFNVCLIDECHKIKKGTKINDIILSLNTNNIYGLTGTIPKSEIDEMNMIGKIGSVIYSKASVEIREESKSIAPVEVKIIKLSHKSRPKRYKPKQGEKFEPTGQYLNEIDFIYNSPWRNKFICDIANKLNGNSLILVDRLQHGEVLNEMLKSTKKRPKWINGEMDLEEREKIQEEMEIHNDIACVAMASIFSTGISIKNLKYVIFVCIGKSFTKVLQSIGRALRLHKDKDKSIIFDLSDNTKYSQDHLTERISFYEEEQIKYEIRKIKEITS